VFVDCRDLSGPIHGEAVFPGGGGLPAEVGADQVAVWIDFCDRWQTEPSVGAPREDEEFEVGAIRPVQVGVDAAEARAWTRRSPTSPTTRPNSDSGSGCGAAT
jgi:hypothetical protein